MILIGNLKFEEPLTSYLFSCYDVNSEYFKKMNDILCEETDSKNVNLHHIIPRSFFKKSNLELIDKGNLKKLTFSNHFLVHYYAWKCAKPFIRKELASAMCLMFNKFIKFNNIDEKLLKEIAAEYEKAIIEKNENLSKKIICLETKEIYESITEAENEKNIFHIYRVLNGERKTAGGFHWEYYNENINYSNEYITEKTKKPKKKPTYKKPIICLETNQVFESCAEAVRFFNFEHKSSISNNLRGLSKSCKGYHFKFI